MFKDKSKYPTLTRMSYCQCRLKLVFASVFRQFKWQHVALLVDRSELFSLTVGKNLEYGLRQEGLLSFVRELNGNEEEIYENYLRDASMYARGKQLYCTPIPLLIGTPFPIPSSGDSLGARCAGAKVYAGGAQSRHDQRRMGVPRCGDLSERLLGRQGLGDGR